LHNDTALPDPIVGEGSSHPIILSDGFHFYDEIVQAIYVSELLKTLLSMYSALEL